MTASISARNRSRRVTFPFWLHAMPANVRCSAIPNLPRRRSTSTPSTTSSDLRRASLAGGQWHGASSASTLGAATTRKAKEAPMADDRTALPSPEKVIDAFQAFHRTAAVKAGVELDLFTAIGEGVDTVPALATRCQAAERGIRILCDYLVVIGFLRKAASRYALAIDAATFLDRHSPAYFGSTVGYFACETNQEAFARLTAAVRQGKTALPEDGALVPEHPVWVEFARAM